MNGRREEATPIHFIPRLQNASCRIVRHLEVPVTQNDPSPERNRSGLCREYSVRLLEELPPVLKESQLEILETIAAGAFGRAVKVRHRQFGCLLVVKEVLNNSKENEETLIRELPDRNKTVFLVLSDFSFLCGIPFEKVSVLRNLKHPNILTCLAIVVRNKRLCLVTEYIDRGSIHQILLNSPEEQPPSFCTRVSFARDIATGMAFIHENNIIHRDLTTHNCLARQDGSVVVSDFGLSKIIQPDPPYDWSLEQAKHKMNQMHLSDEEETETNKNLEMTDSGSNLSNGRRRPVRPRCHTVVGSPFSMAPEMLAGKPYDQSVDVYSFGVIICQLLALCDSDPDHIPRCSDTLCVDVNAFMATHSDILKDGPPVLINAARQCLSFQPADRPSFNTCRDWLDECLLYLTSGKVPPEGIMER
ncbi:hypothetical protein T265_01312 [Opisthorchis viverrini]|uniref:Protein kinase domain-containing protein n=1 Tax=Opisthorchis viverrini TaxID=6198 RepID=A0A074ZYU3_OPIVI|nr:hypothetical protein T265_01312 [Opisthorchis viverrini]KER32623.1 hypothetical protein T265_01312 [Opisthorchis viverrini]